MMTTNPGNPSAPELTDELTRLDNQVRDLSQQWDMLEQEIAEKIQRRRTLIAEQEATQADHSDAILRLQGEIYAARDRLKVLRDAHFDFSCLYRIVSEARRPQS
jgi:cell division septum initiation protein DivIVA